MITTPLRALSREQFHRPELVDDEAAQLLDAGCAAYGKPVTITSDGRPLDVELAALRAAPEEAGKSDAELLAIAKGSLHVLGRAFDLAWPTSPEDRYALLWAFLRLAFTRGLVIEVEPVKSHLHIGFAVGWQHSRLVFS